MDFEHAQVALKALARFHALGFAMKHHKPEHFELLKKRCEAIKSQKRGLIETFKSFIRTATEDPEISAFSDFTQAVMTQASADNWATTSDESWSTIVHFDFWVNNIMFHKDAENDRVDNIKFVDFQNYLYQSPLRELVFFITTSVTDDVMKLRFDELLDVYYEAFIDVLGQMKCDTERFTRDKFDERLKFDAYEEFPHCMFMLKIITADIEEDDKCPTPHKIINNQALNDRMLSKMRRCVKKFVQKGWINKSG